MDRRVYDNYVMQIAEYGSLTKAAAALGISQPALSSGLTALEKELGFAIFNRRKNPITFTSEGEIYYEFVQRTRILESDMQKRIDAMHTDLDKSLVIGAPVAYMDSMVSDAIVKLLEEHTDYKIALKSGPLAELMELASKGEVNCFVSTSGELPEKFETQLIKEEKLFLCMPRDAECELNEQKMILLEEGQPLQKEIDNFLKANDIRPKSSITVNQVSTAVNLALRGVGACVASEDALNNVSESERQEKLRIYSLQADSRKIYIAYDKELKMPTAGEDFIKLIIDGE